MREILFRGKRTDNGEWVYGNLVRGCDEKYAYIVEFGNKEMCSNYVNVNPDTVGQYTGLKDKNGTKIFEGDIGRRRDDIFLIDWSEEKAAFVMVFYDYMCEILYLEEMWDDAEVIGNIHDNPELLEV